MLNLRFLRNSYVTWKGRRLQIDENAEFEVFKGLLRTMGAKKARNHQIASFWRPLGDILGTF